MAEWLERWACNSEAPSSSPARRKLLGPTSISAINTANNRSFCSEWLPDAKPVSYFSSTGSVNTGTPLL